MYKRNMGNQNPYRKPDIVDNINDIFEFHCSNCTDIKGLINSLVLVESDFFATQFDRVNGATNKERKSYVDKVTLYYISVIKFKIYSVVYKLKKNGLIVTREEVINCGYSNLAIAELINIL